MHASSPITVGRYLLHREIARGGMATIHIARLLGDVGFSRIVAAKRLNPELAEDKEFVAMFLDEARIASKVHHRNVVPVLDVVAMGDEVVLVQEYVHGAPLWHLMCASSAANAHIPIPVAAAIACQVLAGLHAAHEAVDETGTPLHIVHRDVSPQNIIIATDGSARLVDFGVAKASVKDHVTRAGTFKGKIGYSSPEQLRGEANKQSDIYSLGVVLWEMLVGHRLHANTRGQTAQIAEIMSGKLPAITESLAEERAWVGGYRWRQIEALEPIIRKALDVNYRRRWPTAADMEEAIAAAVPLASSNDIAAWLRAVGKDFLEEREKLIAEEEASWRRTLAEMAQPMPQPAAPRPVVRAQRTLARESAGPVTRPERGPIAIATRQRRSPAAIIAMLVIVLGAAVSFGVRALDRPSTHARPAPSARTVESVPPLATSREPPAPPPPAPVPATEVATPGPRDAGDGRDRRNGGDERDASDGRDEREERLRDLEAETPARAEPKPVVKRKRPISRSASRERSTRSAAAAKKTPAPAAKRAVDCTPYHVDRNRKITKPGCR